MNQFQRYDNKKPKGVDPMNEANLDNGHERDKAGITLGFKKESVASSIAEFLRNAMINGLYKPGDKLKEKDICGELNISRTPLREAFRILQSEGLLTYSSHHGVMVTPVSVEDIKNLWEIRFALEVMATKKAVDNMTDKDFQELRRLQNQFEELDAKDKTNIIRVNSNLHMHIIKAANNNRLEKIIRDIWTQIQVIQSISFIKEGRFEKTCDEHKELISAIMKKDKELVGSLMQYHLTKGMESLLEGLKL
jgi:DNA-binding GntR family transcriptional regulator